MSILDWSILILMLLGLWTGYRQGLMIQLVKLVSLVASYGVAFLFYKPFAEKLTQWFPFTTQSGKDMFSSIAGALPIQQILYYSISFALLFIGAGIVFRWVGSILNAVANLPILSIVNHLGGGFLGLVKSGLILLLLLVIAYALPIPEVQQTIDDSVIGSYAVKQSPGMLELFQQFIHIKPDQPGNIPMENSNSI